MEQYSILGMFILPGREESCIAQTINDPRKSKNPQPQSVVDFQYGGEPWLAKTTIRRRLMIRMFGEVA
jgi:hypothetical protein